MQLVVAVSGDKLNDALVVSGPYLGGWGQWIQWRVGGPGIVTDTNTPGEIFSLNYCVG